MTDTLPTRTAPADSAEPAGGAAASQRPAADSPPALSTAADGPVVQVERPRGGLAYNWGLQAIIDMWMAKRMLADRGEQTNTLTWVPMLRMLADDPAQVERDYAEIRSRRERIRLWDSPRERWRKHYGNFVRESEWALLELRRYFPREQYEEVVVGTLAVTARLGSGKEISFLSDRIGEQRDSGASAADQDSLLTRIVTKIIDPGRFAGFLVGESEMTEMDLAGGTAVMEVPNCAWHTCGDPASLPNPRSLPEEGCLLVCKGLFERLFDGSSGLSMSFDPHLPETSCTVRMTF
jgi:hypothetical protein